MKKNISLIVAAFLICTSATSQTYNSDSSSAPVIFLDFDGQTVVGTSWNYNGPIICSGSGLTQNQIQEIFNRVAEDYRPFTVNVTTDSLKFLSAPLLQRIRVIITITSAWYGNTGGVSFISSFAWGDDTPCFIFSQLLNFNTKNIAEAISHEAGHTLGLFHQSVYDTQCNKITDYNTGTGTGEISWAPIMGIGYSKNLTLWHTGPNSLGCSNIQDDINVITNGANGIALKPDDIGNTIASSKLVLVNNNNFQSTGIFEHTNDTDLFKIIIPVSSFLSLAATPLNVGSANAGANIDIQTDLLNSNLGLLKSNNPAASLNASLDTNLSAGIFYLRIKSVANINSSTYGMVGKYFITGTLLPLSTLPLYKFGLTGKINKQEHQLTWQIERDELTDQLNIEYSGNGNSFAALYTTSASADHFSYTPASKEKIFYRLKLVFKNGEVHYSNIIYLSTGKLSLSPIITNPVADNILRIHGNNDLTWSLYSIEGKKIQTGKSGNGINVIPVPSVKPGLYLIIFKDATKEVSSQKILFQ